MPATHARCYSILNTNSAIQLVNSNDNNNILILLLTVSDKFLCNNRTSSRVANYMILTESVCSNSI